MKSFKHVSKPITVAIFLSSSLTGLFLSGPVFAEDKYVAAPAGGAPTVPAAGPAMDAKTDSAGSSSGGAIVSSKVFFKNLKNGQTVKSPVKVEMGVTGMKVRNAGEDANDITTGHHHIIIDGGPIKSGEVVPPNDPTHMHFGKGQTEAEVKLSPGPHTLTLQFADGAHRSYGEALSATVKVMVK